MVEKAAYDDMVKGNETVYNCKDKLHQFGDFAVLVLKGIDLPLGDLGID